MGCDRRALDIRVRCSVHSHTGIHERHARIWGARSRDDPRLRLRRGPVLCCSSTRDGMARPGVFHRPTRLRPVKPTAVALPAWPSLPCECGRSVLCGCDRGLARRLVARHGSCFLWPFDRRIHCCCVRRASSGAGSAVGARIPGRRAAPSRRLGGGACEGTPRAQAGPLTCPARLVTHAPHERPWDGAPAAVQLHEPPLWGRAALDCEPAAPQLSARHLVPLAQVRLHGAGPDGGRRDPKRVSG